MKNYKFICTGCDFKVKVKLDPKKIDPDKSPKLKKAHKDILLHIKSKHKGKKAQSIFELDE